MAAYADIAAKLEPALDQMIRQAAQNAAAYINSSGLQPLKQAAQLYKVKMAEIYNSLDSVQHKNNVRNFLIELGKELPSADKVNTLFDKIQRDIVGKQLTDNLKTAYTISWDFREKVTQFLGIRIELLYVSLENGSPQLYIIENDKEFLGSYGKILTRDIPKAYSSPSLDTANAKMGEEIQKELDAINAAYQETLWRFDYSQQFISSNFGLVMIRGGRNWSIFKVINKGDIGEGYASAVLDAVTHDTTHFSGKALDPTNLLTLMTQYIMSVDNLRGALAGDYIVGELEDGTILNYAIKAANSSFEGLMQYQDIADIILSTNDFSEETVYRMITGGAPSATRNKKIKKKDLATQEAKAVKKIIDGIVSHVGQK